MVFKDLYSLFDPAVLFEVRMKDILFFKGTKNQFEKVKNKDYKGIETLQIVSISLDKREEGENVDLSIIEIEIKRMPLFKIIQKECD